MTGYINYLEREPEPRLLRLREIWDQMCKAGRLPACTSTSLAQFTAVSGSDATENASLIEVRRDGKRQRYFVVKDGPAVVEAVGIDSSGTYLDGPSDTPEFNTILISDYDGVVSSRKPRIYAEEHHLDRRTRQIIGIQLPFATDGSTVDWIVEFVFKIDS